MKRMLVLYRELAGYFMNCMEYLANTHDVEIDIVAYPIKAEAPFRFENSGKITRIPRESADLSSLQNLIQEKKYDLIFCGGWSDQLYLDLVRRNRNIPALIGFDKQWKGSMRDRLATFYLRLKIKRFFDYAFVPGEEQFIFALQMGFQKANIVKGAYVCETHRFNKVFKKRIDQLPLKKNLVFVGRYAPEKNVQLLWEAFVEWKNSHSSEMKLICFGTGPLWDSRVQHTDIIHHGFQQGSQMDDKLTDASIFILPSSYEPWGVVVNELAAAGYALALTEAVGARTYFLTEKTGWIFNSSSKQDFIQLFNKINALSNEGLVQMAIESNRLAQLLDEEQYAQSILRMMKA